jgi:hypothetical protein
VQKEVKIFDKKASLISVVILAVFIFPITFVHELGHVMICALDGHSYNVRVTPLAASVICDGTSSNPMLYWSFGGLLAMLVALSPLVAWDWVKRNNGVLIGSLTIATGHGVNAIIETFLHSWYVTNIAFASTLLITIPTIFAYIILLIAFGRIKHGVNSTLEKLHEP